MLPWNEYAIRFGTFGPFGSFWCVVDLPNRQILLRRRPTGLVQPDDTEMVTTPVAILSRVCAQLAGDAGIPGAVGGFFALLTL